MKNKSTYIYLLLIVLLSIPAFWYLFKLGFPQTDDGNWMIIRFSAFYQALREGQFPVRSLGRLNFDYGYPVANFLYPGFMYLAVPLKVVGLSFVESIKIFIAICIIGSGFFAFLWFRKLYDDVSSFFASLFYVYAPYHLFDLSKRGSVGELLSLTIFPFVMWQIERQSLIFTSIGIALLIISHNTLAILFLGIIILYAVASIYGLKKREQLINFYKRVIIFGLGISAFFWIPALFELSYTVFSKTKVSNFSSYFADYNLIGINTIIIFIASIFLLFRKRDSLGKNKIAILMLVIGILSTFFATFLTEPIWNILPVSFIQFPFRLLSVSIICAAFLLAYCLSQAEFKLRIGLGLAVVIATIALGYNYLIPQSYNLADDGFYSTNEDTTTVLNEYMPIWVENEPIKHAETKAQVIQGEGKITNLKSNSKKITFDFISNAPGVVRINTIYYPGWQAYSNGIQKAIFYNNDLGVMEVKLTGQNQNVKIEFGETPLRLLSDLVSFLSFIALFTIASRKYLSAAFKKWI